MRVLVTGASGFVGKYVVDALVRAGHEAVPVGRADTDYSEPSLAPLLKGLDAVVHLAGRRMTREDDPKLLQPFLAPNVVAVENLMRAAKAGGVGHVVLASTIAVYSSANTLPFRETEIARPLNAYGLSKLMAEQAAELHGGATCLRFAAIYGHGEKGTPALMKFINQAMVRETIRLAGNRLVSIDHLYVEDAASAIAAALKAKAGGVYNIGSGTAVTVKAMAEAVNAAFGNTGNLDPGDSHEAPAREPFMDISKARAALGWSPAHDLHAGLAAYVAARTKT